MSGLYDDVSEIMITRERLDEICTELGRKISEDYKGKKLILVGIMKGGLIFLSDLLRKITIPVEFGTITASSYGQGTSSSGQVKILQDLDMEIKDKDGKKYSVCIERIHQEEDVAKLLHYNQDGTAYSLIDYNKSGVPLIEIVTKPEIRSAYQAKKFAEMVRQIVRYLNISNADMEKGQMRCEPNISIQEKGKWQLKDGKIVPIGQYKLNPKTEVKNIGSITAVEKAIEYEIQRMHDQIKNGEKITQQTRGWNADKNITEFQRSKESADDYRYMPEPDARLACSPERLY